MGAGAGGLYFLGLLTHNEHQRETGFLSGESAIDSLFVVEALKFATGRQRPYQADGHGHFWKGGASFPSEHSAGAWAIAGILAHEYPSPFMKFLSTEWRRW
jgi:PAP2 superfamily.